MQSSMLDSICSFLTSSTIHYETVSLYVFLPSLYHLHCLAIKLSFKFLKLSLLVNLLSVLGAISLNLHLMRLHSDVDDCIE